MQTILKVTNLTKKYGNHRALDNVSLTLKKGEIYGLIGRNGAGKTTLLKSITGLIEVSSGNISLFGSANKKDWTKALKRTGSIIESPVAYDGLTAEQNLAYYCQLRGIVDAEKKIQETLELVDLKGTGKKKYKAFSLGMKQKMGIAISILSQPDLLILDEPINGLDPIAIVEFRRLLKYLNEEKGMTIIVSSHILTELYQLANRFGIIHDGRMVQEISKLEFEELNQSYIALKTPDVEQASLLLQERLNFSIKVIDGKSIHIFADATEVRNITRALINISLEIDAIYYSKLELEDYFTNLIGQEGGQKDV